MKSTKFYPVLCLIFLGFCLSCKNDSIATKNKVLPNTPETVSKQWQLHLDKNEIEKATALSTTKTKKWLAENKEIFLGDNQVYQTQFIKMNCQTNENEATCTYTIKEEGELFEDIFLLKKINGQWLVDLEEDTSSPELDEQIFKEMEKELKLD